MWSDNEAKLDLLDFRHLEEAVAMIISNPDLLPATIGVYGDWGSGKSTLIRMVKERIEAEDEAVLCVSFNGWLFEGYDDTKTALMDTVLEEIGNSKRFVEQAKGQLGKLTAQVDWMRVAWSGGKLAAGLLLGGIGVGITATAEVLARQLVEKYPEAKYDDVKDLLSKADERNRELRLGIRKFHQDFEDLLKATNIKALVVFIDDLDRCTPETIIEILEAIRLFLYTPRTVFVIGADDRLVEYAVRHRFPELPDSNFKIGRDYLEKLVQFPVKIPPLGHDELETYINLLFVHLGELDEETHEKIRQKALDRDPGVYVESHIYDIVRGVLGDVPEELQEHLSLAQFLAPVLAPTMSGNPRQTKRFLNALKMRQRMAVSRGVSLEMRVLAKLMLLEHFNNPLFRKLADFQAAQEGKPEELKSLEARVRGQKDNKVDQETPASTRKADGASPPIRTPVPSSVDQAGTENELVIWMADPWVKGWLEMEPSLAEVDLRAYFFFSRDTLGPISAPARRLTPFAQRVVAELLDDSDAIRRRAMGQLKDLNQLEAAGVFDYLESRLRQEENETRQEDIIGRLVDLAENRADLSSQLLAVMQSLPGHQISLDIPLRMAQLAKSNTGISAAVREILKKWSNDEANPGPSKASKTALRTLGSGT